jgi:hypothetical protein
MANRRYQQFSYSNAAMPVTIYAQVTFGASGAPTLNKGSQFISGIVRNSAGDYTLTFRDVYNQLLGVNCVFNSGSSLPAAPAMNIKANSTATAATRTMEIVFSDLETPAATDPASGEIVYLQFIFNNSSISN